MLFIIDHTGTATKNAFCKIVLVSTSAKDFMDPIGIITINTSPKMEEERQIYQCKITALLKESRKRTKEGNTQIQNNCHHQGVKKNLRGKCTIKQMQN